MLPCGRKEPPPSTHAFNRVRDIALRDDPVALEFYARNSIVQPTIDQIVKGAGKNAADIDLIKRRTVMAAQAVAGLVMAPAAAGLAAEAVAFARSPVSYCLASPQACTVAAEAVAYGVAGVPGPTPTAVAGFAGRVQSIGQQLLEVGATAYLGSMKDLANNIVPVFQASDAYNWERTGTTGQSEAHEAAMRKYITDVEKPVAVFDVKHGGGNGFDAAYVKRLDDGSYRLVLPEAKSGTINGSNPFSAFGTGQRGDAQLALNLDKVVNAVMASNLPEHAKRSLQGDIRERRFEIQLFTGETSTLTAPKLDRLREVTGRAVTNVIVLPKRRGG